MTEHVLPERIVLRYLLPKYAQMAWNTVLVVQFVNPTVVVTFTTIKIGFVLPSAGRDATVLLAWFWMRTKGVSRSANASHQPLCLPCNAPMGLSITPVAHFARQPANQSLILSHSYV